MLAEHPTIKKKEYHIRLEKGDLPLYVLLPGDPGRIEIIGNTWDYYEEVEWHREYRSIRGKYRGVEIGAISTGIGGSSTSIAIEELARIGVHTLLRVGTAGSIREDVEIGNIIIATGAVRFDGASLEYAPCEYPAVASPDLVMASIDVAERLQVKYKVGIIASTSSFYLGQSRRGYKDYIWSGVEKRLVDLQKMNVIGFEMEAATIFTLSNIYGLRSGCICAVIANRLTGEFKPDSGIEDAIRIANETIKLIAEADKLRGGVLRPLPPSYIFKR